ncbi:MAG: hypothetical protein OSJ73_11740 [Lachnospiraceae bacterium]|nr:hypothetical protein [Lachnospiraceae bacterium]
MPIDQLLKDELSISEENETTSETEITETTSGAVKLDIMFCTKCGKENRVDSGI